MKLGDVVDPGTLDQPQKLTLGDVSADHAPSEPESQQRAEKAARFSESGPLAGATDTLLRGASFGLSDPVVAGMAAGARGLSNVALDVAGMKDKEPYSAGEAYDATLKARREAEAQFRTAHPAGSTATELLGGFASPGAGKLGEFVAEGATAASRIGRSALVGAGEGATAGAAGSEKDRASGRLWDSFRGGVGGGAIGTALPALGELSAPLAKRVTTGLSEIWDQSTKAITGTTKPIAELSPAEQQAVTERAHTVVQGLLKSSRKTVDDLLQDPNFLAGKPITSAEVIGRPGISQLMSIGRRQGLTPDQLESYLRQRLNETPDRIMNKLGQEAGVVPESVQGNFDQRSKELREANKPLYQAAYDMKNVVSDKLTELMQRPSIQKAIQSARRLAAEEGRNPDEVGLVLKPSTVIDGATGKPMFTEEVEIRNPSMETWDLVKRSLGSAIYRDKDQFGRPNLDDEGRAVRDTLGDLRKELFKLNPTYAKAVAAGGEPILMREAYEKAPSLMKNTVSEDDFRKTIARYSPSQLEALKGGWINQVYTQARAGRLKLKDMTTDAFKTKARALMGDDQADRFIKDVLLEQDLVKNAQRMMPGTNSVTAELQSSSREIDEALAKTSHLAHDISSGNYLGAAARLLKSGMAGYRTADLSEQERNEVGRLLQMPPDQLASEIRGAVEQMNRPPSPADRLTRQILARGTAAVANVADQ